MLVIAGVYPVAHGVRSGAAALPVELIRPAGGLAPHVAGQFHQPAGFTEAPGGGYLVFDRRGHAVYRVDAATAAPVRIVAVGQEAGRIIQPVAFASAADGSFVVADAPAGRERVQLFTMEGTRLRGFVLPGRAEVRVALGGLVLNGVGSLQYDGEHIYLNQPETGSLISEYSLQGRALRSVGTLRSTGHEGERDLHRAFNTGLPLVAPDGGFFFVFQTGEPRFRRYDRNGVLLFERAIQGREIDELVARQPSRWPVRGAASDELPVVPPVVRTAAVDPHGRLWVAFTLPYLYVFDADGDRIRTVQLQATGPVVPNSLSFAGDGRLLVTPGCYWFEVAGRGDGRVLRSGR